MPDYRLTPGAEEDLWEIARYTLKTWGEAQQRRYEAALLRCFEALADGSARSMQPLTQRPEVRRVHCQHHFVFALEVVGEPVTIVAVLHERMDLMRRLSDRLRDL